jgi:anti-sigma factor RsiW
MNCREAEELMFAASDGALDENRRSGLGRHMAACEPCRLLQARLEEAAVAWRLSDAQVAVPDAAKAWYDVRRRIRNGETGANARVSSWRLWVGIPAASLAALALVAAVALRWTDAHGTTAKSIGETARAEYVEMENPGTSPVVFVDEETGWLVVWSVDQPGG